jgi:hypothetical protein
LVVEVGEVDADGVLPDDEVKEPVPQQDVLCAQVRNLLVRTQQKILNLLRRALK